MCDKSKLKKETIEALSALRDGIENSHSEFHSSFGSTRFVFTAKTLAELTSIALSYGYRRMLINLRTFGWDERQRTDKEWRLRKGEKLLGLARRVLDYDEDVFAEKLDHAENSAEISVAIKDLVSNTDQVSKQQGLTISLLLFSIILFLIFPHAFHKVQLSQNSRESVVFVPQSMEHQQTGEVIIKGTTPLREKFDQILLAEEENKISNEEAGNLVIAAFFKQYTRDLEKSIDDIAKINKKYPALFTS